MAINTSPTVTISGNINLPIVEELNTKTVTLNSNPAPQTFDTNGGATSITFSSGGNIIFSNGNALSAPQGKVLTLSSSDDAGTLNFTTKDAIPNNTTLPLLGEKALPPVDDTTAE